MLKSDHTLTVLVAGPCRSDTGDDPHRIIRNVGAINDVALAALRTGYLPVTDERFALPLIEAAGSAIIGDPIGDATFHPAAEQVASRCDACLHIGGASATADAEIALSKRRSQPAFHRLVELPRTAWGAP